ncbi:MBL fold metallo-hydrolase [bacterium]|nr:MBL fold metallo-hydrolase [bacterium]
MKIEILYHSSIRIESDGLIIYFDPYKIKEKRKDADIIFVTHSHLDHYSKKDIKKLINTNTIIVEPEVMRNNDFKNVLYVNPNSKVDVLGISVDVVPSYNANKNFHKKADNFVGYILYLNNETYYVMGDCDENADNLLVKSDNVLIPIGGKYTFDPKEAAAYINKIKPKRVYPHHLSFTDASSAIEIFKSLVDKNIEVVI